MSVKRSKDERAADLTARAMWANAEAQAVKRPAVAVALKAVRGIDKLVEPEDVSALAGALRAVRDAGAAALDAMGVPVP